MKIENERVYNMHEAIRAMRLSYGSDGDSKIDTEIAEDELGNRFPVEELVIGEKDAALIKKLIKAGASHRKFMRAILLTVDITAPRYWWIQFDTYKVGVTAISESTMHTIMKKPITFMDFAHLTNSDIIDKLEEYRSCGMFEYVVANLPQSYLQKRHVAMNYEVVRNIIAQRRGHKLAEWQKFIEWAQGLPCAKLFFGDLMKGDKR